MSRRAAREAALQILYKADIAGRDIDVEHELTYWLEELADGKKVLAGESYEFALSLIQGTLANSDNLDRKINETALDWDLTRMDVVDRNLMRLALYEMVYCPEIPQRVSVNEAVELSKIYCGGDSAKFINGILDRFISSDER
jgi:N utilization substance protein B